MGIHACAHTRTHANAALLTVSGLPSPTPPHPHLCTEVITPWLRTFFMTMTPRFAFQSNYLPGLSCWGSPEA